VSPQNDGTIPFAYEISIGVDPNNKRMLERVNAILKRNQDDIKAILDDFGVPRVPVEQRSVPAKPVDRR
jgi:hypothetical protein